jgi:hypothetical protein
MKKALIFTLALIAGGGIMNNVMASKAPTVTAVKAEVILGHRIGPSGQEMLVTK